MKKKMSNLTQRELARSICKCGRKVRVLYPINPLDVENTEFVCWTCLNKGET